MISYSQRDRINTYLPKSMRIKPSKRENLNYCFKHAIALKHDMKDIWERLGYLQETGNIDEKEIVELEKALDRMQHISGQLTTRNTKKSL